MEKKSKTKQQSKLTKAHKPEPQREQAKPRDEEQGLTEEEAVSHIKDKREVVLVTGASGKLGRELIKVLLKKGDTVRALVSKQDSVGRLPGGVVPFVGDINDTNVVEDSCNGVDTIFHLAAIVSQYKAPSAEITRTNVDGTKTLLEAAQKQGVKHFFLASSVNVYGAKRNGMLDENAELKPSDPYGYSKVLAEQMVRRYKDTVPFTIFRIAAIYGPGFEATAFKLYRAAKAGKYKIIGKGSNHTALIHVYDVIRAMLMAKNNAKSIGNVYNLSDGANKTQEELAEITSAALSIQKPKRVSEMVVKLFAKGKINPDELRFLTSDRQIDISKIKGDLGFTPLVDEKEGIEDMVRKFLASEQPAAQTM